MLSLSIAPAARPHLDDLAWRAVRRRMARMLGAVERAERGEDFEVAVRMAGDAEIRALNRDYRNADRATDVLAFSQREGEGGGLHPEVLGDIVISVETAARQQKQGLFFELVFLYAHGLCHLLGYDHQTDAEEAEMDTRVAALLAESSRRGRIRAA